MNTLTKEVVKLLDKLYNLRGEDSEVLVKMELEREEAEETKKRTSDEKESLQTKIDSLLEEEANLKSQGEKLSNVLSGINEDDYQIVIEKLGLDFNPQKIKEKLDTTLPETINLVVEDTNKAEIELQNVEEEMNDAITKIEELSIRKDNALALQDKLNEYFELALNGNINITRDAITSLLEKFGFNEEEQREAAKILMFPEDALYDYDQEKKGGKSISEVFAEAKEYSSSDKSKGLNNLIEDKEDVKETVKKVMKDCELDYLDYTSGDIDKIAKNYDEDTLKNNVDYAKTIGMNVDIFSDHVELLTDKEFIKKVEKLMNLEKTALDVYLNPGILIKYDYEGLLNSIESLKESGLDPKKIPLMAF